jgi:hypothetical protein
MKKKGRPPLPRGKAMTTKIQVRLTPDEFVNFKRRAKRKGVTVSALMRSTVEEFVRGYRGEKLT